MENSDIKFFKEGFVIFVDKLLLNVKDKQAELIEAWN